MRKFQKKLVDEVRDHSKKLASGSQERKFIESLDDDKVAEIIGKVRTTKGAIRRVRSKFAQLDETQGSAHTRTNRSSDKSQQASQ